MPSSVFADETVSFDLDIAPLFRQFCADCHGADLQEADFRVDTLKPPGEVKTDLERWENVLEMVAIGDMPPEDEAQPSKPQRKQITTWIEAKLKALGRGPTPTERALPKFANRVDHDELFSGEHTGPAYTPARVWRVNEHIYSQLVEDLELGKDFVPPLKGVQGEGFDDYATLYADEAAIRTMLQNGKRVATTIVHGRLVKPRGAGVRDPENKAHRKTSRHKVLTQFAAIEGEPTRKQMEATVRYAFDLLLHREPSDAELTRYVASALQPNVAAGGADAGLRGLLVTMLLSPEFLFRMEMGLGPQLEDGRRMLSPHELAYALSFALYDTPIDDLLKAADQGRLATREDVEREVRAMLDTTKHFRGQIPAGRREQGLWPVGKLGMQDVDKPRMLRFFREYFDYAKAVDVFKDDIRHGGVHKPRYLVEDADWFVLSVLNEDREVLAKLLTSDEYYIGLGRRNYGSYATVYGLTAETRSPEGPSDLPHGERAGMLTHPAWLVAHSGNFETDPVRRGKWIQEHLLGGVVPDLPIGVEAQLPEEPHHTIRERFRVVRESKCWRCHKKMNPLGEPLEIYDDFGVFRRQHHVNADNHVLASILEVGHKRREKAAQPKQDIDATGELRGTGDAKLDGEVTNALDLTRRLAKSDRVRQVFLRHVFRFWMGRNETLNDSPTLMAMDKAYVESGGSFKETLVVLLTSDSFLYRK